MNASLDESVPATLPGPPREAVRQAAWLANLLRPIRAFRWKYLPLLMVYFAYGALGLIDISRDMWIKESLTLNPAQLAEIGVWLSLPWTIKMVFGELVDTVPIFGSQRKAYILIGALLTSSGLLTLAGAAGGWLTFAANGRLNLPGALLIVIGTVIQDVVADAMSTEVVSRYDDAGNPRQEDDVRSELGMVQVLGAWRSPSASWRSPDCPVADELSRLRDGVSPGLDRAGHFGDLRDADPVGISNGGRSIGASSAAASHFAPWSSGWRCPRSLRPGGDLRPIDVGDLHHAGIRDSVLDTGSRLAILFTSIIIFRVPRNAGGRGRLFLVTLDILKFDEGFYGTLRQTAAVIALAAMWFFSKQLTEYSVTQGSVLARGRRHDFVPAEHRFVLRRSSLDRGTSRLWRPHHCDHRRRNVIAVRPAQHDSAAHAGCSTTPRRATAPPGSR